ETRSSHGRLLLASSRSGAWRSTIGAYRQINQARLELHAQAQPKLLQLVFNLIERLFAEVAILEHFGLSLLGKLTDSGDIRVVRAIGRAHAQRDVVHGHIEQLLQLEIFFADAGGRLVEFDHFFVVVHKDVEVMPQNRRRLEQRVIGRQAPVGPDFENQFVVVGALTDTSVLYSILHACDWRKD